MLKAPLLKLEPGLEDNRAKGSVGLILRLLSARRRFLHRSADQKRVPEQPSLFGPEGNKAKDKLLLDASNG